MNQGFGDIAQTLLNNGYTPIPIRYGTKIPAIPNWQTTDYSNSPKKLKNLIGLIQIVISIQKLVVIVQYLLAQFWLYQFWLYHFWLYQFWLCQFICTTLLKGFSVSFIS